jgi:hypothetical protein
LKILVVFANPRGTSALRLGEEDRTINECFRRAKNRDGLSLRILHASTVDDIDSRSSTITQSQELQAVLIGGKSCVHKSDWPKAWWSCVPRTGKCPIGAEMSWELQVSFAKAIIPLNIDGCSLPGTVAAHQQIDFRHRDDEAYNRLWGH